MEINEIENRKAIKSMKQKLFFFFLKNNKVDDLLAVLNKKKREKTQITNCRNKRSVVPYRNKKEYKGIL